jgi:hypothetical protein
MHYFFFGRIHFAFYQKNLHCIAFAFNAMHNAYTLVHYFLMYPGLIQMRNFYLEILLY